MNEQKKPDQTTAEEQAEREKYLKSLCDEILYRAATLMSEAGAPTEMMLDRMITFSAAHACGLAGSPHAAETFRMVAQKIEGGLFHSVTGEEKNNGRVH